MRRWLMETNIDPHLKEDESIAGQRAERRTSITTHRVLVPKPGPICMDAYRHGRDSP